MFTGKDAFLPAFKESERKITTRGLFISTL